MDLSLREAATLTGRPARTLRGQLARGELQGTKRDGRWWIARHSLPMTEPQRLAMQARADEVRSNVEAALPSRTGRNPAERRRSVLDLDGFRAVREVFLELVPEGTTSPPPSEVSAARHSLERGLLDLSEAVYAFELTTKITMLRAARGRVSRAIALLLTTGPSIPCEPRLGWIARLENVALPSIGGLLRWAEKIEERRR